MSTYPQFYRKNGTCVKVLSEVTARIIVLPPDSMVAERMTTTFPTAERMRLFLNKMEECNADKYREFNATFYMDVAEEIAVFRSKQMQQLKDKIQ